MFLDPRPRSIKLLSLAFLRSQFPAATLVSDSPKQLARDSHAFYLGNPKRGKQALGSYLQLSTLVIPVQRRARTAKRASMTPSGT